MISISIDQCDPFARISGGPPEYIVCGPMLAHWVASMGREIETCGGYLVLWLLIKQLGVLGKRVAYISLADLTAASKWAENIAAGDTIVIYPEMITNNPLKARHVVRWILYYTSKQQIQSWKEQGDHVVSYCHEFTEGESVPLLYLTNLADNRLFSPGGVSRAGISYRIGKGAALHHYHNYHKRRNIIQHLFPLLPSFPDITPILNGIQKSYCREKLLPNKMNFRQMRTEFRRAALFVSYDPASATSIIAALCGCPSVIVPLPPLDSFSIPANLKYGVAYGYSQLPKAIGEARLLRKVVADFAHNGLATVTALIAHVEKHFHNK